MKFTMVKMCCNVYPTKREVENRERSRNDFGRVLERLDNGYRMCAIERIRLMEI